MIYFLTNFYSDMKLLKKLTSCINKVKLIDVLFLIALVLVGYTFYQNRRSKEAFSNYTPNDNTINFVLFYANWCPHCQQIEPVWDKLTTDLHGEMMEGVRVNVMKFDCAKKKHERKCSANDVSSYPTIKLFTKNKTKEYEGKRDYESFEEYLHNEATNL